MSNEFKYHSSCHCQAIQFDFVTEERLEDREYHACNCTICQKNGYINYYIPKSSIVFKSGEGKLREYSYPPHNRLHNFCPNCGTSLFIVSNEKIRDMGKIGINLRSVDGLAIEKMNVAVDQDGRGRDPADEMKAWEELKAKGGS